MSDDSSPNAAEDITRIAYDVTRLTLELADATKALAEITHITPEIVTALVPSDLRAADATLRQVALVLDILGNASEVRTQGWTFDPTPSAEGSDRLISLAHQYAAPLDYTN